MSEPTHYDCERHGRYLGVTDEGRRVIVNCPTCVDENDVVEGEWRAAWRYRKTWERSGVPDRYRDRTLENWRPQSKAQEAVKSALSAYVADLPAALKTGRGLILLGPCGTGKTHLIAGIIARICSGGMSAGFVRVGDLFANIKRSFDRRPNDRLRGSTENETNGFDDEHLRTVDFLVLDDLGASRGTEWETSVLHDLLAHRYDYRLPTIVSTNVPDFDRYVGQRVADRFDECALRITIPGTSLRKSVSANDAIGPDAVPEPPNALTLTTAVYGKMMKHLAKANETGRRRLGYD